MFGMDEEKVNKILTIVIIVLTVFILVCAYILKVTRSKEQERILELRNVKDETSEVIYTKKELGVEFNFDYINEVTLLDEYNGYKFIRFEDIYYVIDEENTYSIEYLYDESKDEYDYRYCIVKDKDLKIDFSDLKFIKNND